MKTVPKRIPENTPKVTETPFTLMSVPNFEETHQESTWGWQQKNWKPQMCPKIRLSDINMFTAWFENSFNLSASSLLAFRVIKLITFVHVRGWPTWLIGRNCSCLHKGSRPASLPHRHSNKAKLSQVFSIWASKLHIKTNSWHHRDYVHGLYYSIFCLCTLYRGWISYYSFILKKLRLGSSIIKHIWLEAKLSDRQAGFFLLFSPLYLFEDGSKVMFRRHF